MTDGEKAAAILFFVVGLFLGGLVGLTLGHDLTVTELTKEPVQESHGIDEKDRG